MTLGIADAPGGMITINNVFIQVKILQVTIGFSP